jgi:hypothetical protein
VDQNDQEMSPVEQHVERSYLDPEAPRKLSRRQRQTRRTVEQYLRGGVIPRYMERLRDIDRAVKDQRALIGRDYELLREEHANDPAEFARRWRARAEAYRFDTLNELIHQHNEYYPIERQLPIDPRTRDYVKVRGRSYRRPELNAAWVLEQFPADL